MGQILSDNGLEFQNEDMKKLCERFGIRQLATTAESPWSNGQCERTVGLLKDSVRKMKEGLNRKVCLCWSESAKNCLYNSSDFLPNQLVFGKNTILPNITGNVSIGEIEEGNESEMLGDMMIGLHRAREIQVQQEADSKIKRALRNNIREHNLELAEPGEEVYYKREGERE